MSEDAKLLKIKLGNVKGQLTRFDNYLTGFEPNGDINELTTRLERVELNSLHDFDEYQTQLQLLNVESDYDIERDEFETKYYSSVSRAKYILSTHNSASSSQTQGSSQVPFNDLHAVRLPPINLPIFDGSFDRFLQFFDTFKTLIHDNKTLVPTQKFYYLQSSLKGEALQTIQSIQISDQNYFIAWKLLCDRYQNQRIIINSHIKAIFDIHPLNRESKDGLRNILDSLLKGFRSLEALGQPVKHWDSILIYLITSKLDNNTRREWECSIKDAQLPSFQEFTDFLNKKCQMLETLGSSKCSMATASNHKVLSHVSNYAGAKCFYCKGTHWLNQCKNSLSLSPEARLNEAKRLHLCLNCLRSNHTCTECKSSNCKKCNRRHHTLLHFEFHRVKPQTSSSDLQETHTQANVSIENNSNQEEPHQSTNESIVTGFSSKTFSHVLLSTANVCIFNKTDVPIRCRVLLDSGSQSNYITYDLADKLKLELNSINLPVTGISQNLINIKHALTASIKSVYNDYTAKLDFLVIKKITENLPSFSIQTGILPIPKNINLADINFNNNGPIDLLLGAGIFYSLLCVGQIKLGENMPILQKTQLGWIIAGPLPLNANNPLSNNLSTVCNLNTSYQNIEMQLEKFWQLEECSERKIKYSREELECEEHFRNTFYRDKTGRFIVSLPFKEDSSALGDSRENAIKRFYGLEKRLNKDPFLREQYSKFISEYISLGHMSLKNEPFSDNVAYYLPHHRVLKETSETTKCRVVFDASAKTSTGVSLNDILKVGPTIQEDLFSIVLRFRIYNYVITSDIEKMYRMVNINNEHRNFQQIIWRFNQEDELQTYTLNTVTYGTAPASFLAIRCLHQLAYENIDKFPDACKIILRDFYVDDLICGASTISEDIRIKNEIYQILANAGFILRKWASNNRDILEITQDTRELPHFFISNDKTLKTLGIFWDPNTDILKYQVNFSEKLDKKVTKRFILGILSRIFDPLGLLGPITMRAKLILQELWKQKLDWDETVPPHLFSIFTQFYNHLLNINEISIPRHSLTKDVISITLHIFCDASQVAYGACAYLVSEDQHGQYSSHLLTAKSRVAPLKSQTLPRLELCGAVVAAHLAHKIRTALSNISIKKISLWTDSTNVLSWLRIEPSNLKTFISNRISEIISLTNPEDWNHVRSSENPADIISRGMQPDELANAELWWFGPTWLRSHCSNWTHLNITEIDVKNENLELKQNLSLNFLNTFDSSVLMKFSSFTKLKHVIAYCKRFINNASRYKLNRLTGPLSVDELRDAMTTLIYIAQMQDFSTDIQALERNAIKSNSKLSSLSPFLDSGLIRVGGRLRNSSLSLDHKHPYILDNRNPLSKLLIEHEHKRLMHAGPQAVVASLRSQVWILNAKNTVKGVIRKCLVCFKANPKFIIPRMSDLPSSRVTMNRPFSICGVDFAGPFLIKDGKARSRTIVKSYLCVFVCFATKAAHLELVSDMSLDAFLNSLKRFVSRRGVPNEIHSDNGSNFKAADNELQKIYTYLQTKDSGNIRHYLNEHNIKWVFIPPRSPHFGGLWEACVKSAKFHIKRILADAHLTFEQLYTVIVQVEAILNSRPLIALLNDPGDLQPLTPSHFLIGDVLTNLPQQDLSLVQVNRLSQYQRLQHIVQHFLVQMEIRVLLQPSTEGQVEAVQGLRRFEGGHDGVIEGRHGASIPVEHRANC